MLILQNVARSSVVILNTVILSVANCVMLSVIMPSDVVLSVFMVRVITLSLNVLNVFTHCHYAERRVAIFTTL